MKEKSFSKKLYHIFLNSVCQIARVFFRRFTCCSPAFLAVWGGQTERETPLCNIKLHAARFVVCVGLAALVRVLLGISGKPPFEVGVVGADMD